MIYFILNSAWIMYQRKTVNASATGVYIAYFLVMFSVVLTCVITQTPQTSLIHVVCRGVGTVTFAVCLIYTFVSASLAIVEIEEAHPSQARQMSRIFTLAFASIVGALVSWITDNLFCARLQALPVYINLHAYGWHVGTGMAVYFLIVACTVQRCVILGINCEVAYLLGFWPYVRIKAGASKSKSK